MWKAVKVGDRSRANKLQKLIPRSRSARFLAIRQITQLNAGKKTAGVDGIKSLNCQRRFELERVLKIQAQHCIKQGLYSCLKTGVNPEFPSQGTPQGGVVSPVLANIALNGIENIHNSVRYADDMVFILTPQDDAEKILQEVEGFLAQRGLNIKANKTRLVAATDGFDFLGWHFQVQNHEKFRSIPSEENYKAFRKKVKAIVNNSNYGASVKAQKLSNLVRGGRYYHQYCRLDGFKFLLYFIANRAWKVFAKEPKLNRYKVDALI